MLPTTRLHLSVSPETAARLPRLGLVTRHREGKTRRTRFRGTRYDTARLLLRKQGFGMELLTVGDGRVVQRTFTPRGVKVTDASPGMPDVGALAEEADDPQLRRRIARWRLVPVFHYVDFAEVVIGLAIGDSRIRMQIRRGILSPARSGRRKVPVAEVVLALESGNPLALFDIAIAINEYQGARIATREIPETGYRLQRPALDRGITKGARPELSVDMSVLDAFRAVMSETLDHLLSNQELLLASNPDAVHQTRVALRRIRAALRAFKAVLPYDKRKAFNGELRWFQQRLGAARDWQVFREETIPKVSAVRQLPERGLERLRSVALGERRRATREAIDVVGSRRYTRLQLHMLRWLNALETDTASDGSGTSLLAFACRVLERARQDMLLDERPLSRMTPDELHTLRKRGKKARYATEFFAPLWAESDHRLLLTQLRLIQEKLGETNDAVVARRLLLTLHPGRLASPVDPIIQDWSRETIRQCLGAAQPHWRRFQRCPAFWKLAEPLPAPRSLPSAA